MLKRLKADQRTAENPVVILTALKSVREAATCARLGAVAWITKPITFEKSSRVVPLLHLRWLLMARNRLQYSLVEDRSQKLEAKGSCARKDFRAEFGSGGHGCSNRGHLPVHFRDDGEPLFRLVWAH